MAFILPDSPPRVLPGEVLRVFKAMKNLPDSYYIWHHLAPWQIDVPDFLMIDQQGHVLLILVSLTAATEARPAAQMLLIDDDRTPLGHLEQIVLNKFISSVDLPELNLINHLIIYPNISDKQVQASRRERQVGEAFWVGRELLQDGQMDRWKTFFPTQPAGSLAIEKIRQKFTPEIIVPEEMTVRPQSTRRLNAGLSDYLLDFNQEAAVKNDLIVREEDTGLEADFRLNIINGVAGSGKTLILLYRLRLLIHLYPDRKFLVLTHNRPLSHDLQSRFSRLNGSLPANIEWDTFNGWCFKHWPEKSSSGRPLSMPHQKQIIHRVWQEILVDSAVSRGELLGEINWIKDQLPMSKTDYLRANRRGRGFGLTIEQRNVVWKAYLSYQEHLKNSKIVDWADLPIKMWNSLSKKEWVPPTYDFILIDEVQFFAPIWMNLIQASLNGPHAHLFLVADPTQGFLGRRGTWKAMGLDARGRTHLLRQSYRTTKEIMQFATLFYRQRLPEEQDEDVLTPDLLRMPAGIIPQIIPLTSSQDEITRVANEVADFVNKGIQRNHLLVLHSNAYGVNQLVKAINERLGKSAAMDPKTTFPGDYVRVTTLNAGAGLESPIVFLVGLRTLFEEEQSLRLADDEREMLIQDNTRKIYMAATRAGQRLVFTYVGELPAIMKNLLFPA